MNKINSLISRTWQSSSVYRVFNIKDERGKGRLCMLLVSIFGGIAGQLSGGLFYTGFLVGYGLNIVNIGILTFIPSICTILHIFTPLILERIKKRRLVLGLSRLAYYAINIVGITLLPVFIKDRTGQMWGFIAIVVLANSINALFGSGYTAWHANFLPDNIRAEYSITSGCISSFASGIVVLIVSLLTDALKGSPEQLTLIILFRYIAFAFAAIDVLLISLPKEYPYGHTTLKPKITDIFTMPVKNKRFMLTIVILCLYNFVSSIPNATLNTYLLNDIHVSYTFLNAINAVYFLFFIVFGTMWRKFIAKKTWFKALAYVLILQGLTYIAYAFVTAENYEWYLLIIRLSQHVLGVVVNTIIGMLPYVNLPDTDRMSYISFHAIMSSIASFLSMMFGTFFTAWIKDATLNIFGLSFSSTAILLFADGFAQILLSGFVMLVLYKVTPPEMMSLLKANKKQVQENSE